jgi:DNA-binding CsgD family transcriptional regulator
VWAKDAPSPKPLDLEELSESGLLPYATLRPDRVYSLQEMLFPGEAAIAERQAEALARHNIAHARFVRVVSPKEHEAWLILLHDRRDFGAADSALLSALTPHLALALDLLADIEALRLRAETAEEALGLLGVGQAAFDAEGRVLFADDCAAAELDAQPNARPPLRAREAQALAVACSELAGQFDRARRLVNIDERKQRNLLLRPALPSRAGVLSRAAAVGLVRKSRREAPVNGARVISAVHGLSPNEAALAEAVSRGRSIIEAGAELQLTPETARNYSKRIYAKTGASGQADLVRLVLTGLAPFA